MYTDGAVCGASERRRLRRILPPDAAQRGARNHVRSNQRQPPTQFNSTSNQRQPLIRCRRGFASVRSSANSKQQRVQQNSAPRTCAKFFAERSSVGHDCTRWSAPCFWSDLKDRIHSFPACDANANVIMFTVLFRFEAIFLLKSVYNVRL